MRRLAFADLRAHRLRTLLSIIAVTLGVALVTGAMTLTGTMTHAASSLSASAYDDVDAAVEARSPVDRTSDVQGASRPSLPASRRRAASPATPGVAAAAGEVLREDVKITGAGGKVSGSGPYFGVGFPFTDARRAAPVGLPARRGRLARRRGRRRDRRGDGRPRGPGRRRQPSASPRAGRHGPSACPASCASAR